MVEGNYCEAENEEISKDAQGGDSDDDVPELVENVDFEKAAGQ